ncbi:CUB domain-containing protein 2-like [Pocillopora verrucosa]|uniref:CUB domain-containing protein 2-like n=1 Tax=Pocillopora verrucosa TaxID=203993 RepID=UPI00333FB07B
MLSFSACIPPGESITATSGHISSPNFPNNYDANRNCTWNITVPTGKIIKLTFLNFTLVAGENDDCAGAAANSARVFITNVASHGGKPNDFKICGQKLPHPVYSEGNVIQVRFESRTGLVNKGFNATFQAIDGDSLCPADMILDETSGSFSSPFNPRNYLSNQTCSWNITGKQGYRVELTIPDYNLERCGGAACSCDYMEVQNSFSDQALPGKLCGTPRFTPVKFYSLHESLRVVFVSDDANMDYDGFGATYKLLNYSPPICPREAIPLSGSGKISSTNYPKSNYTASRNCTWNITAPVDKKIQFEFTDFALSECSASPCSDSCSYVELYDGGSTGSPLLGRFCQGSPWNELQFSTGNQLSVMFHPGQTVARGFEAQFSVLSTTTTLPSTGTKATNETTTSTESKIRTDSRMATTTSLPKKSLSAGASVGIALGSVAFVLLVFIMVYSCHRHVKKNKRIISPSNEGTEMEENQQRNKSGCAPDT